MHYRWKTGMLAWVLFRVTGLALVGYLTMHIIVISNLHNPAKFDQTMAFLGSWPFRILELGLFLVVLYHALNGVRIFMVDFFKGSLYQARLFWGLMAAGVILFAAGAFPMLSHALYWKNVQQGKAVHASSCCGETEKKAECEHCAEAGHD
jgi:succinate dehydrogenase / fumarate reductase cytochrome b subunit